MDQLSYSVSYILQNCHAIYNRNLGGISHTDSIRSLPGGGNCINWIAGHLVVSRDSFRRQLGLPLVIPESFKDLYKRGSENITPANAVDIEEIKGMYNANLDGIIEALPNASLQPNAEPYDTLLFLCFHESYHVGQLGLARRTLGFEGTIK
ncbi:MAG: DinB family protein [Bacteroidetes bacterium]|nr:DinB family protein [Bacteroidota bacterium]